MYRPLYYPAVTEVIMGGDGALWLRREGGIASESVEWLVVNKHGTPVARVTLPATSAPLWVSEDRIWAREADALGLVYLVEYIVHGDP